MSDVFCSSGSVPLGEADKSEEKSEGPCFLGGFSGGEGEPLSSAKELSEMSVARDSEEELEVV